MSRNDPGDDESSKYDVANRGKAEILETLCKLSARHEQVREVIERDKSRAKKEFEITPLIDCVSAMRKHIRAHKEFEVVSTTYRQKQINHIHQDEN